VPVSEVASRQQLRSASRHSSASTDPTISSQNIRPSGCGWPEFWNSLADELCTYSSDRFKVALKTFLFATHWRIQRIRGFRNDVLYKLMIDTDIHLPHAVIHLVTSLFQFFYIFM